MPPLAGFELRLPFEDFDFATLKAPPGNRIAKAATPVETGPEFPPRLLELLDRYYLHDAQLASFSVPWLHPEMRPMPPWHMFEPWLFEGPPDFPDRLPSFTMTLQVDASPKPVIILDYRNVLVRRAGARRPWPPSPPLEWRHDEVDLLIGDDRIEFTHHILFDRGFELRLQFEDFDFATLKAWASNGIAKAATPVETGL